MLLLALASSGVLTGNGLCDPAEAPNKSFVAGPRDPDNPLHIYRLPITQNVKRLADKLADGATSDAEKIARFMRFIAGAKVGVPSKATPDAMISEMTGACGDFSNTLAAMASTQGIKTRLISMGNWPVADGHAVVEAFIDDAWRLYDPTYGISYHLASDPERRRLSFDEIRAGYQQRKDIEVWGEAGVLSEARAGAELYTGHDIFLNARPAGVIGPDKPFFYPLTFDLRGRTTLDKAEFGPTHQGASFIGAGSTNHNQDWTLLNLVPGKRYAFIVEPSWLGGDLKGNNYSFTMAASLDHGTRHGAGTHEFDFVGPGRPAEPWKIIFTPAQADVVLRLQHAYRGPDYRYMMMQRYTLAGE